jgi:hypothetical protein
MTAYHDRLQAGYYKSKPAKAKQVEPPSVTVKDASGEQVAKTVKAKRSNP